RPTRTHAGDRDPARPALRLPLVPPRRPSLRPRPHHPLHPPRPRRTTRPNRPLQPRPTLQTTPPSQNPPPLALPTPPRPHLHLARTPRIRLPRHPARPYGTSPCLRDVSVPSASSGESACGLRRMYHSVPSSSAC